MASCELYLAPYLGDKLFDCYVQEKTKIFVHITPAFSEGEELSFMIVRAGWAFGVVYGTDAFIEASNNFYGDLTVKVEVVGTKGTLVEKETQIYFHPYSPPRISGLGYYRANDLGEADSVNGTKLYLLATRKYSSIIHEGTQVNRCAMRIENQKSGAIFTVLSGNDTENIFSGVIDSLVLGLGETSVFRLCVFDSLGGEGEAFFTVPAASAAFHLGKGGKNVAIGQFCDYSHSNAFDIGFRTYFNGGVGKRSIVDNVNFTSGDTVTFAGLNNYTLFMAHLKATGSGSSLPLAVLCCYDASTQKLYGSYIADQGSGTAVVCTVIAKYSNSILTFDEISCGRLTSSGYGAGSCTLTALYAIL